MFKINHLTKDVEIVKDVNFIEIVKNIEIIQELIWFHNYKPIGISSNITLDRLGCQICKQTAKIYDGETCDNCNLFFCKTCEPYQETYWYCKKCKKS